MTYGFSRDDAGKFLKEYKTKGLLEKDPFQAVDQDGVGRLVALASEEGRKANPKLNIGVCGEHGGEPSSIEFFHNAGVDYVSCSPFRVPVAIISAAQAQLKNKR
jgi:pyruvate,orthophosphate dikinase